MRTPLMAMMPLLNIITCLRTSLTSLPVLSRETSLLRTALMSLPKGLFIMDLMTR